MKNHVSEWDTSKSAIGARMVAVRTLRGFPTSRALAERLGISPQRLNNYEIGNTTPPPDILAKLSRLTGATADYILFGRIDGLPYDLAQQLMELDRPNGNDKIA